MGFHIQKRVGRARMELKHLLHLINIILVGIIADDKQHGQLHILVEMVFQGIEVHFVIRHLMQDDQVIVSEIGQGFLAEAEIHLVVVVQNAPQGRQIGMRRGRHAKQFVFLVKHLYENMPHIVQQLLLLDDAADFDVDGQHTFFSCIQHEVDFLGEAVGWDVNVAFFDDAAVFFEGQ